MQFAMHQTVICPTPAMVERYYRLAAKCAADFFQTLLLQPLLAHRWRDYAERNRHTLQMDSSRRNLEIALILFYLGAGLVEGILLVQMLDAGLFAAMDDGRFWYALVSVFAAFGPLGCSLWAGYCFGRIRIQRDPVIAGRLHVSWGWLAAFLAVSAVYLAFVGFLAYHFKKDGLDILGMVPLLALVELILGIPAASGLSALTIVLTERFHFSQLVRNSEAVLRYASAATTHFRHFQLYRNIYNRQHPEFPLESRISPRIERAIEYYEGRVEGDIPPYLPPGR